MDRGKREARIAEFDELMKMTNGYFQDTPVADNGMRRAGVADQLSSGSSNCNRLNKAVNLPLNHQVASNINPSMWQHPQFTSDSSNNRARQSIANSLPITFDVLSPLQTSFNTPKMLNWKLFAEGPNIQQCSAQSSTFFINQTQQLVQQQATVGCYSHSRMAMQQALSDVLQHYNQTSDKTSTTRSGSVLPRVHPNLQIHQSRNLTTLVDQLKPGKQTMPFGSSQASLHSNPQFEPENPTDWVNQTFQRIQEMKQMYLPVTMELREKALEQRHKATNKEDMLIWEKEKSALEKIICFLHSSTSDLARYRREDIDKMIHDTLCLLLRLKIRYSRPVRTQPQQADASANRIKPSQKQSGKNYLHSSCVPASLHHPLRKEGSQMVSGQNAFGTLHQPSNRCSWNAISGAQHQMINSSRNNLNSLDSCLSGPGTPAASLMTCQQTEPVDVTKKRQTSKPPAAARKQKQLKLKQPAATEKKKQEKLKQPAATGKQKQQKLKQPAATGKQKQQMLQKMNGDTSLRQHLGLNQKFQTNSPQKAQTSSSQLKPNDLSSRFLKSAIPTLSASPSAVFPSLLTPLTPYSTPADSSKSLLSVTPDSNQIRLVSHTQDLVKPSCLNTESICPGDKQPSCTKGSATERLVEVVRSISYRALKSAVQDIVDVSTGITDTSNEHHSPRESTRFTALDLADDIFICGYSNFTLADRTCTQTRMKRKLKTMTLYDCTTEMEILASNSVKRLKKEINNILLEEIKQINQKHIDMVLDVTNVKDDVFGEGSDEGTLVKCSYSPVGFSCDFKIPNTSNQMFPNMILEFIVPADYPNSSPNVLETLPPGCSETEGKCMWTKAKSNFELSLRRSSKTPSVTEMAEAWKVCAEDEVRVFAQRMGGGSFSSRYGNWENFVMAV